MFLHIGENNLIPKKEIVAIIDAKASLKSEDTKNLLEFMGERIDVNREDKNIRTYIITSKNKIYKSKISSKTLVRRSY
ncbi:MAG TPA: extracellular matrix/biofilm biosynthesis regulator RemA family protein [Tissierellales bacterium]|nr:extracellular matrix/biofilm biosynthesis regulator RemA family protein [Tissierellales bacterium]